MPRGAAIDARLVELQAKRQSLKQTRLVKDMHLPYSS
jgi:hypothetical protein